MSTSPIQSGNPFQELSRLVAETVDKNRDGQVSQDEFATFLTNLLRSWNERPNGSSSATTGTSPFGTATEVLHSFSTLPMASAANRPHMSGFSATKLSNPSHDTPKYIFGRLAQDIDLSSVVDKASAEALLQQMRPELEAAGMTILDIEKDRIQVSGDDGEPVWVDVIWGAESGRPAFQWLVHSPSVEAQRTAVRSTSQQDTRRSERDGNADRSRVRS